MRHLRHVFLFSFCFAVWPSNAQTPSEIQSKDIESIQKTNSIYLKVNPLKWIHGPIPMISEYGLSIEGTATSKIGYQIGGGYLYRSPIYTWFNPLNTDLDFTGYRLELQARYYFAKTAARAKLSDGMIPSGFFIGLNGSYSAANMSIQNTPFPRLEFANANLTVTAGAQVLFRDKFGLELFGNLGIKRNTLYETDSNLDSKAVDLVDFGMTSYYAGWLKIGIGMNVTFGLI